MNEPLMDPMHLFNHIYARINQENVKPYQSMVWDVLKSSFSALPVGLGTMLDEKDCTDEKIETFCEEQSTQTIMRRRNDYWNDTRISVFCGMTNRKI